MSYSINFGTTYGNVSGSQWSTNTNSKPEQYQASAKSLGNLLLYFFNEMLEVIFPNFFLQMWFSSLLWSICIEFNKNFHHSL